MTALLVAATAACSAETSPTPAPIASPIASPTATVSPSATPTPTATPGPSGIGMLAAGTPFDAETILTAMRESRRPGGVPDQLQTDAIAAAVATSIWTFEGLPWTTLAASGSCGPASCTLELAGTRPDSQGDDVWVFDVRPADGTVDVASADLRALPNELVRTLDELARSLLPPVTLDGLLLTSASWLAPPDVGQFVLAYRGDGEEGSCGLGLRLDAVTPDIAGGVSGTC